MRKLRKFGYGCAAATFVVFVVLGFVGLLAIPNMVQSQVEAAIALTSPDSTLYELWQKPAAHGVKVYEAFYVYNLTNPTEAAQGAVPTFDRVGPYTYLENGHKPKGHIAWYVNGTVQYTSKLTYTFQPDMSVYNGRQLTESDMVTHVNIAVLGVAQQADELGPAGFLIYDFLASTIVNQSTSMFVTHNASELLFGYNDPLLAKVRPSNPQVQLFSPGGAEETHTKPSEIYTGEKAMHPGEKAIDSAFQFSMWSGHRTLPYWGTPYANMINGSDGTQFKPNIQNSDLLYTFTDAIKRSGYLEYNSDVDLHGVTLKRFMIGAKMMLSQKDNPDNAAFGMIDQGFIPQPGVPVTISGSQFRHADLTKVNVSVNGFNPPLAGPEDDIHLDIEPMSGAVFNAQKKLQLNVWLRPLVYLNFFGVNTTINITAKLTPTYFPIVMAYEYGAATESVCNKFISQVYTPLRVGYYGGIIVLVVAALMAAGTGYSFRQFSLKEAANEEATPINK